MVLLIDNGLFCNYANNTIIKLSNHKGGDNIGSDQRQASSNKKRKPANKRQVKKQQLFVVRLLNILTVISFVLMGVFIALIIISKNSNIQEWYGQYLEMLTTAQLRVESMDDKFSVFLVLIFLFLFKAIFPFYLFPLSALCAVTSTVFKPYLSIPINLLGLALLYSTKYFWGRKVGASSVQSILNKSETVSYLIQLDDGRGNPWLLAFFRLIPGIPVNLVSKLYGAMGFKYKYFLMLSFIGYSPLLISYTFIGRNVFNPLSTSFLLPLVMMFMLLGVSMMTISRIIKIQSRRRRSSHHV